MLSTRQRIRTLGSADLPAFLDLCEHDPVVNVFADYRARTTNLEPRWLGGEVWGRFVDGELTAACHVGANLVPVQCTVEDAEAFAARALQVGRSTTTLVGPEEPVEAFWQVVSDRWRVPREIRRGQPHLRIDGPALVAADPLVRPTGPDDFDAVYPACVAMYTEEVGVSPEAHGGANLYRARVLQLINRGWSFARFDDAGRLIFKAEVACATPFAAQVQGVWVHPERRGEGLATIGMAAVVDAVRRGIAPVVSLYVNDWNTPARRAYQRVGFVETARFTTVMF